MNEENITQDQVNQAFKEITAEFNRMVDESGRSPEMFIALDDSAPEFLFYYQQIKERVESLGLVAPELVKGLELRIEAKG